MAWNLIHRETGVIIRGYSTQKGARIGLTRANRLAGWNRGIRCETLEVEMRWSKPLAGGPHWWAPYALRHVDLTGASEGADVCMHAA